MVDIASKYAGLTLATDSVSIADKYRGMTLEVPPSPGFFGRIGDMGIDAFKSSIDAGESAVGLADLATGNLVGNGLAKLGFDPERTRQILDSHYTPQRQQENQDVAAASGFLNTIIANVQNPAVALGSAIESSPMMLGSAGVVRSAAINMLEKKGLQAGTKAAADFLADPSTLTKLAFVGASTEGVQQAGQLQEQGREAGRYYIQTAPEAIASGAIDTAIGFGTGIIPGLGNVATKLGTAGLGSGRTRKLLEIGKEAAKGFFQEGVLQELPQSSQEQIFQNFAMGDPWAKGVPEAGAMGLVAGGLMGFVGGGSHSMLESNRVESALPSGERVKSSGSINRIASAPSVDEAIAAADQAAGTIAPIQRTVQPGAMSSVESVPFNKSVTVEPPPIPENPVMVESVPFTPAPTPAATPAPATEPGSSIPSAGQLPTTKYTTGETANPAMRLAMQKAMDERTISALESAPQQEAKSTYATRDAAVQAQKDADYLRALRQKADQDVTAAITTTVTESQPARAQPAVVPRPDEVVGNIAPATIPVITPIENTPLVSLAQSAENGVGNYPLNVPPAAIPILRSNGQPFGSAEGAAISAQFKSNPGASVVSVEGGFGIQPKMVESAPLAPESAPFTPVPVSKRAETGNQTPIEQPISQIPYVPDTARTPISEQTTDDALLTKYAAQSKSLDQLKSYARGRFGRERMQEMEPRIQSAWDAKVGAKAVSPVGAEAVAQRQVNAVNRFIDSAVEQFGVTREQASSAWNALLKERLVSVDSVGGQYKLKTGAVWDKEVILRAASLGAKAPSQTTAAARAPNSADFQRITNASSTIAQARQKVVAEFGTDRAASADQNVVAFWKAKVRDKNAKPGPNDSITRAIAKLGGINTAWMQDITGDTKHDRPGLFQKTGTSPDDMASKLVEAGYIVGDDYNKVATTRPDDEMRKMIADEISGARKHYKLDSTRPQEEALKAEQDHYENQARADESRIESQFDRIAAEYGQDAADQMRQYHADMQEYTGTMDSQINAAVESQLIKEREFDNEAIRQDAATDTTEDGPREQAANSNEVAGETGGRSGEAAGAAEQEPFGLNTQSEKSLRDKEARASDQSIEAKSQIDRERELFGLDRPAGNVSGVGQQTKSQQRGMFDTPVQELTAAAKALSDAAKELAGATSAMKAQAEPKQDGFDSASFNKARQDRIDASLAARNTHLDKLSADVETMRGKKIYYVHDPKVKGVIRTADRNGNVYVNWSDKYSADAEMATETKEGKKTVFLSSLGPTDLKDYVLADTTSTKGALFSQDYRINHRPMTVEGGASTLDDLTSQSFDDSIYGRDALQNYGSGDARESQTLRIMREVRGKPDAMVTIYRSAPTKAEGIHAGDWVTLDRSVAQDYVAQAEENEGVKSKVISMKVPASHITAWADSLLEFGYYPPIDTLASTTPSTLISSPNTTGLSVGAVTSAISESVDKLNQQFGLDVIVLKSVKDLPPEALKDIDQNARYKGAWHNGAVYLFADNIPSAREARVTLAHELVGHKGILGMLNAAGLSKEWQAFRANIDRMIKMKNAVILDIAKETDRRYSNYERGSENWHKEFIAIAAERREKDGPAARLWREFKAMIRQAMRYFSLNAPFSESDLDIILANSERYLRESSETMIEGDALASQPNVYDEDFPLTTESTDNFDGVIRKSDDSGSIFDGIFAKQGYKGAALGDGKTQHTYYPRKGMVARDGDTDLDSGKAELFLKRLFPTANENEIEALYDMSAKDEGLFGVEEYETVAKKYLADDLGEASWKAQNIRGRIAADQGFDAIAMNDETGVSYLIPYGSKAIYAGKNKSYENTGLTESLASETAPTFYSTLLEAARSMKQNKGSPDQMLNMLRKTPGVKQEELEWIGVEEYARGLGASVTKQQLADFIAANGVKVETVELGQTKAREDFRAYLAGLSDEALNTEADNSDISTDETLSRGELIDAIVSAREESDFDNDEPDGTKFAKYQLPGGTNYREVLLTIPADHGAPVYPEPLTELPEGYDVIRDRSRPEDWQYGIMPPNQVHGSPLGGRRYATPEDARTGELKRMNEERKLRAADEWRARNEGKIYKSGHWDQPNVIAHIRLNDRTDANGNKVLFVEEIQSDWHQAGRKKGYRNTNLRETRVIHDEMERLTATRNDISDKANGQNTPEVEALNKKLDALQKEWSASSANSYLQTPDAPFKNNGWAELSIKQVLRMAAEGGYDSVAWTTGEQQSDRYDLSKQVGSVTAKGMDGGKFVIYANSANGDQLFQKVATKDELPDIIGKDLADKIIKDNGVHPFGLGEFNKTYRGIDLKVGGEGMKGFYDRTLPNLFKDVARKLDKSANVGSSTIPGGKSDYKVEQDTKGKWIAYNPADQYDFKEFATEKLAREFANGADQSQVQSIPITDKMREGAMQGQALFSKDQTNTPAFRKWFGESKVVDKNGAPKVVYRGTPSDNESGAYYTDKPEIAEGYMHQNGGLFRSPRATGTMFPVYLSMQNPLIIDAKGYSYRNLPVPWQPYERHQFGNMPKNAVSVEKASDWAIEHGYDGLIVRNVKDSAYPGDPTKSTVYVVTDHTQIKSAIGNNGDFNPDNPNILFSKGEASEFEEENRRLRDEDKTIWNAAKNLLQRGFAPGGLLPDSVFRLDEVRHGQFGVVDAVVESLTKSLDRAVRADYGVPLRNLSDADKEALSQALGGKIPASVKGGVREALVAMRQYIDELSGKYAKILEDQIQSATAGFDEAELALYGAFMRMIEVEPESNSPADKGKATKERNAILDEGKDKAREVWGDGKKMQAALSRVGDAAEKASLMRTVLNNQGQYVHRSYQVFDDPKWNTKVSIEVVNKARRYLMDRMIGDGATESEASERQKAIVDDIMKNGTAYNSMESFIKESKLGAKDLSVLKTRKQIAPEIRALMGEYKDPRINFTKSATKMGRLIANQKFLEAVRDAGMGIFLFDQHKEGTDIIAAEGSEVYSPLNGLYAPREVIQAFKDALGAAKLDGLYGHLVRINGLIKMGKTVASPTTAMRNMIGGPFQLLMNGHFSMEGARKAWQTKAGFLQDGELFNYVKELRSLGVINDNVTAGEIGSYIREGRFDEFLGGSQSTEVFSTVADGAQKFYGAGDNIWKIIGFEAEKARLMKYGKLSETKAKEKAAARTRDTYTTYSRVGAAVKWISRFPLFGTFPSFTTEIVRNTYKMLQIIHEDMNTPGMKPAAYQRIAGMAAVSSIPFILSALAKAANGFDDDDEEAVKVQAPPWQQNSNLLLMGRDEKGNIRYLDTSFIDPYSYFKRPINAMLRDQPWEDAFVSAAKDLISPWLGADIAAQSIGEAVFNKDADNGGDIYNRADPIGTKVSKSLGHVGKDIQPGIMNNINNMMKVWNEETTRAGKKYTAEDEVMALLGVRMSTLDPKSALFYRALDFKDAKSAASSTLTRVLTDPNNVDIDDIENAYETALKIRKEAYDDMAVLVKSAKRSGLTDQQIQSVLRARQVSTADVAALIHGKVPRFTPTNSSETGALRRATAMLGKEKSNEIRNRYETVRKVAAESGK